MRREMPSRSATRKCATCNRTKARHLWLASEWNKKGPASCKSCWKKSPQANATRDRYLRKTYGITHKEYEMLLTRQNGRCFICHKRPGKRRLAVDHDHSLEDRGIRNSIRGLLCQPCNEYLGHIGDDPAAHERAALYLRQPPAADLRKR